MKFFDQIAQYLYLKKDKDGAKKSTFTKMMHGMNRISILMFLLALIIMLIRAFKKH